MAIKTSDLALSFLRGKSENLKKLENLKDGAFYLTTDTHRLYTAIDGKLQELNKSVDVVASATALPSKNVEDGQFTYIKASNILAYYDGEAGNWIQINPDTVTVLSDDLSSTSATTLADNKGVEIKSILGYTSNVDSTNTARGGQVASSIDFPFELQSGTNIQIAVTTPTKSGNAAASISANTYKLNENLDIPNKTYGLNLVTNNGSTDSPAGSVNLVADSNISFSKADATKGGLKINSKDTKVSDAALSFDAAGTLGISISSENDPTGELTGNVTGTAVTPTIRYGGSGGSSTTFKSGTAALSVYTKSEIDSLIDTQLKGYNALSYQGGISNIADFQSADNAAKIGDTWIITSAEPFEYDGKTWSAGDLVVYNGTEEDTDGKISKGLTRILVPSGNDLIEVRTNKEENDPENQDGSITTTTYAIAQNGINKRAFRHDGSTNVKVELSTADITDQTANGGGSLSAIVTTTSLVWGTFD